MEVELLILVMFRYILIINNIRHFSMMLHITYPQRFCLIRNKNEDLVRLTSRLNCKNSIKTVLGDLRKCSFAFETRDVGVKVLVYWDFG